jgi:cysteine desulfurase family protein
MKEYSFNSGRGGYKASLNSAEKIYAVREKISNLVNVLPENVVFTQNCTMALNMAIKGSVKQGDHIIISSLEHNAVARTVYALQEKGIAEYSVAKYSFNEDETVENFRKLIKPNTTLIVSTQASNVFGCAMPIKKIGELAKNNGIRFVVDGAQGVGLLDIDVKRDNIDVLCCAGHKGLYGALATGFMALNDDVKLSTIVEGGTGSESMNLVQPDYTPDRFEAGTLNNSGIISLGAGIDFVNSKGKENIFSHEMNLISYLYKNLSKNDDVVLYTPSPDSFFTSPILSFNFKDYSSEKTATLLANKNVAVRGGFQCAPLAHRSFGTDNRGVVRISPSAFSTIKECEKFLNYLKKL